MSPPGLSQARLEHPQQRGSCLNLPLRQPCSLSLTPAAIAPSHPAWPWGSHHDWALAWMLCTSWPAQPGACRAGYGQSSGSLHSDRGVLTASELTALQDAEGHAAEVDATLAEGAERHLAHPWRTDLQLPTFKDVTGKLDVASGCLESKHKVRPLHNTRKSSPGCTVASFQSKQAHGHKHNMHSGVTTATSSHRHRAVLQAEVATVSKQVAPTGFLPCWQHLLFFPAKTRPWSLHSRQGSRQGLDVPRSLTLSNTPCIAEFGTL